MKYRQAHFLCCAVLLTAVFMGCGADNPLGRQAVSGTVTVDGRPLHRGMIQFTPRQHEGMMRTGAVIGDGKFSLSVEKGLPAGEYVVGILAVDRDEDSNLVAPPGSDTSSKPVRQRIPAKYNVKSTLVREVTADGPNVFDFDIKTK